ncbi:hemocyte protein-glutamine gamma-glutamyltransferase-like [Portunus trituberculatus]|uniref:hemocyte protein-glutamine gamma-glutamyltransferase-like n=1 Tax=Portunus trituberculatus TaxID=210409 RepID=UPI001E1CD944|nr:hemocyte protein-glutamine gamma-glutamyltransferase-like [Portunus trituberculatus]
MASNRVGSDYNSWINTLRSDFTRDLRRRNRVEAEAEKPPTGANKVDRVHWYIKDNAKNHKTKKYEMVHDKEKPKPVLRRGQLFYLAIRFHETFDQAKDRVVLNFRFGHKPSVSKGTMGVVMVNSDKLTRTKDEWDCRIDPGTRGKDLVVQVYIPVGACVGIYHLEVLTGLHNSSDTGMNNYLDETDCYILFNPWCKDDVVYMDDEQKREEYVMNDKGKVWVGSYKRSRGRPWAFGQFDDVVLPLAVYLLEISRVSDPERGNPVKVVRGISAGIEGGPDGENWDSIWNFHVWNDAWMARNDLPPGYGGWQAIDATPQEESDYKMQCGPTSLVAIRRGDIGLNYDSPFVFAEVNADLMHWGEDPQSEWGWSRMKMNKYHIGRAIMTKSSGKDDDFGDDDGEDVVNDYKNTEGSVAERMAIQNAIRGSRRAMQYYNIKSDGKEDVAFDLIDIDKITMGHPFQVNVVVRNESNEKRKVYAVLNSRSLYYTGVNVAHIKKAEGTFVLEPNGTQEVAMTVQFSEYWPKLVEQCLIKIYAICRVEETQQTWTDEDDFTVDKPRLDIQVSRREGSRRRRR